MHTSLLPANYHNNHHNHHHHNEQQQQAQQHYYDYQSAANRDDCGGPPPTGHVDELGDEEEANRNPLLVPAPDLRAQQESPAQEEALHDMQVQGEQRQALEVVVAHHREGGGDGQAEDEQCQQADYQTAQEHYRYSPYLQTLPDNTNLHQPVAYYATTNIRNNTRSNQGAVDFTSLQESHYDHHHCTTGEDASNGVGLSASQQAVDLTNSDHQSHAAMFQQQQHQQPTQTPIYYDLTSAETSALVQQTPTTTTTTTGGIQSQLPGAILEPEMFHHYHNHHNHHNLHQQHQQQADYNLTSSTFEPNSDMASASEPTRHLNQPEFMSILTEQNRFAHPATDYQAVSQQHLSSTPFTLGNCYQPQYATAESMQRPAGLSSTSSIYNDHQQQQQHQFSSKSRVTSAHDEQAQQVPNGEVGAVDYDQHQNQYRDPQTFDLVSHHYQHIHATCPNGSASGAPPHQQADDENCQNHHHHHEPGYHEQHHLLALHNDAGRLTAAAARSGEEHDGDEQERKLADNYEAQHSQLMVGAMIYAGSSAAPSTILSTSSELSETNSDLESVDSTLTRDEKRAREANIPLTYYEIVNLSIDQFNEHIARFPFTEAQLTLMKDIRRRGKNKAAAQTCRKKKMEQITELQHEVCRLANKRMMLSCERAKLSQEHAKLVADYDRLCLAIKNHLNDGEQQQQHATSLPFVAAEGQHIPGGEGKTSVASSVECTLSTVYGGDDCELLQ